MTDENNEDWEDRAFAEIDRLRAALAESQAREAALSEAAQALSHVIGAVSHGRAIDDADAHLVAVLADPSPAATALLDKARRCDEAEAERDRLWFVVDEEFVGTLIVEERDAAIARAEKAEAAVRSLRRELAMGLLR